MNWDDFDDVLTAMVERHPHVAPAHWPADDLDRLIEDWGTLAYRAFRGGSLFAWLLASLFAVALRQARLWRKMKRTYR
jgi:hypothetical protein